MHLSTHSVNRPLQTEISRRGGEAGMEVDVDGDHLVDVAPFQCRSEALDERVEPGVKLGGRVLCRPPGGSFG